MPKRAPANPDKFDEASKWFRGRTPVTKAEWELMSAKARRQSFTIAGTQQLKVVQTVFDELQKAIDKGTPIDAWRKALKNKLKGDFAEKNAHNLTTAFINANQTAYNTGRYYQLSDPSVTASLPYWGWDSVMDTLTSPICTELNGTVLRHDDPWWLTHWPPLHHNAIAADSLIETIAGPKRAGNVTPGTRVLTHMGRWKRVTAVLRKQVADRPVRVLTTLSGRTLRVTHEHPVLRAETLSWEPAGNLHVGDAIFQKSKQSTGVARASVGDPKNAPPLRHQPGVTNAVAASSRRESVILPVHLDANESSWKRYVDNIAADAVLCDGPEGAQEIEQIRFLRGEFLTEGVGEGCGHAVPHIVDTGWIPGSHATLVNGDTVISFGSQAPGPMILPGPSGDHVRVSVGNTQLFEPGPERDSVHLAPSPDDTVTGVKLALKRTHAPTIVPVLHTNESIESDAVREVEWHAETIISIVDVRYSGELVDLTVEDDESYVASGIIVHNCRSSVRGLTAAMAKRKGGVTETLPRPDIKGDFGLAPPLRAGQIWEPKREDFDPSAWTLYQRNQGRMKAANDNAQTKPVVPPSTRLGEVGEKVFGRKLTDAEIDALVGMEAKLPPGQSLTVFVRESARKETVTIGAGIVDAEKNTIGTFSREFTRVAGEVNVNHAAFFIEEQFQNAGIGRNLFNAQIDAYVKHGIGQVSLEAAEVGKYVWTKAGFEWTSSEQIASTLSKLEKHLKDEVGAKAAKKILKTVQTPQDISRLVINEQRVGKKFLIDLATDGTATPHIKMAQKPSKIKRL